MGTDEDVCVVNFQVENKNAGQDLVDFLESGYEWILDAAVSPGTNRHGKYLVFVEMERDNDIRDNLGFMLKEVSKVFSFLEVTYKIKKYKHLIVSPHNTSSAISRLISAIATFAPSLAASTHVALPIPLAPPVTIITLSSNIISFSP